MTGRPHLRRLATATATALGLAMLLAACGQSQAASSSSSATSAGTSSGAVSPAGESAANQPDLSGVTLRIGETGWKQQQLLLHSLFGATDEELAIDLGIAKVSVKKRWGAIYEKVRDVAPVCCRAAASAGCPPILMVPDMAIWR